MAGNKLFILDFWVCLPCASSSFGNPSSLFSPSCSCSFFPLRKFTRGWDWKEKLGTKICLLSSPLWMNLPAGNTYVPLLSEALTLKGSCPKMEELWGEVGWDGKAYLCWLIEGFLFSKTLDHRRGPFFSSLPHHCLLFQWVWNTYREHRCHFRVTSETTELHLLTASCPRSFWHLEGTSSFFSPFPNLRIIQALFQDFTSTTKLSRVAMIFK